MEIIYKDKETYNKIREKTTQDLSKYVFVKSVERSIKCKHKKYQLILGGTTSVKSKEHIQKNCLDCGYIFETIWSNYKIDWNENK